VGGAADCSIVDSWVLSSPLFFIMKLNHEGPGERRWQWRWVDMECVLRQTFAVSDGCVLSRKRVDWWPLRLWRLNWFYFLSAEYGFTRSSKWFLGGPCSDKLDMCMLNKRRQCESRWKMQIFVVLYQIGCQLLNSDVATHQNYLEHASVLQERK
jgi:hypothetical protein